jgi:ribosomal protein S18 acetylase RimI-like enzyme
LAGDVSIELWRPDEVDAGRLAAEVGMLAGVLHASVHGGASVSFVLPFSIEAAEFFWRDKVLPAVRAGSRRTLVAIDATRIIGTVQLDLGTPPNQRHRGEVLKLLVHPDFRNRGVARALMTELESVARSEGRTLLTLDTRTGDKAEPLYRSLGYVLAGVIPDYARDPSSPVLEPTSFMYKHLQPERSGRP